MIVVVEFVCFFFFVLCLSLTHYFPHESLEEQLITYCVYVDFIVSETKQRDKACFMSVTCKADVTNLFKQNYTFCLQQIYISVHDGSFVHETRFIKQGNSIIDFIFLSVLQDVH